MTCWKPYREGISNRAARMVRGLDPAVGRRWVGRLR